MDKNILDYYKKHRPILHYSVEKGWMNDPNGLLYYQGYYHLYYQFYPDDIKHGPMHWGHARSGNLIEWENLPIALYPDENGVIFSGSLVADEMNTSGFSSEGKIPLVAVFTHNFDTENSYQQYQSLAYSLDQGFTFTKYSGNPVLTYTERDFRDPKIIWHEETNTWIMPVVAGKNVRFYASDNLKQWEYLSTFKTSNPESDDIWECPNLCKIHVRVDETEKWVLIVSVNTADRKHFGMQYFVGEFDGISFFAESSDEEIAMLDYGFDNYAAVTYGGIKDRTVIIGWMNCWYYGSRIPASDFRGSMTIPRELSLKKVKSGYRILQEPIRELKEYFIKQQSFSDVTSSILPSAPIIVQMILKNQNQELTFSNIENNFKITIDSENCRVIADRRGCGHEEIGEHFYRSFSGEYITSGDFISLTILIDVTSVEIFVNEGETVLTIQYFIKQPFDKLSTNGIINNIEIFMG